MITAVLADETGWIYTKIYDQNINKFRPKLVEGNIVKITRPFLRLTAGAGGETKESLYLTLASESTVELLSQPGRIIYGSHLTKISQIDFGSKNPFHIIGAISEVFNKTVFINKFGAEFNS